MKLKSTTKSKLKNNAENDGYSSRLIFISVLIVILSISSYFFLPNLNFPSTFKSPTDDQDDDCIRFNGIPSSRQFFEDFVSKGKPVIFSNIMKNDKSWVDIMNTWNNEYIVKHFGDVKVKVSVSPSNEFEYVEDIKHWPKVETFWKSFLDIDQGKKLPEEVFSKAPSDSGFSFRKCDHLSSSCLRFTVDKVLVRPARNVTTLKEFMNKMQEEKAKSKSTYYVQYESIPKELEQRLNSPSWANFLPHDLTGLWLGLGPTKANLHYDPNENLMFMISGSKKWTLFEPDQSEFLYEGFCKEGKMEIQSSKGDNDDEGSRSEKLVRSSKEDNDISFFNSPVDLSHPDYDRFPLLIKSKPKICHLRAGEILYLPAFWWHQVESTPDGEGRTLGVNYWYSPYRTKPFPCPTCQMRVNRKEFPVDPKFK